MRFGRGNGRFGPATASHGRSAAEIDEFSENFEEDQEDFGDTAADVQMQVSAAEQSTTFSLGDDALFDFGDVAAEGATAAALAPPCQEGVYGIGKASMLGLAAAAVALTSIAYSAMQMVKKLLTSALLVLLLLILTPRV